jgi:hypothetical protein
VGNPQTITLNGKQYDALTGKLLEQSESPITEHTKKTKHLHGPKSIDGFISDNKSKNHLIIPTKPEKPLKVEHKPKGHKIAPFTKRSADKSKTLMRSVVHKPDVYGGKSKLKPSVSYRERVASAVSTSVNAAQPAKEALSARAQAISKSALVTKFGDLTVPPKKTVTPDPNQIQTTANSEVHLKNLEALAKQEAEPETETKDVFEEAALKLANSYESIKRKQTPFYDKLARKLNIKTKTLVWGIIVLVVLIILGSLTYIFMNNLKLLVATERTGIHTSLPSYTPSGFGLSNINYVTGTNSHIDLVYKSNSDSRNYTIYERPSTTDSQGLVYTILQSAVGSNYQTYDVGGRSVYSYGNHEVWVDSGIYFSMTNNAGLTQDQLSQIINSI